MSEKILSVFIDESGDFGAATIYLPDKARHPGVLYPFSSLSYNEGE